ncbi:hypothetical protein BRADI_4g04680v3 [Brachypodium distachyon]|uniref:Pectinesterase inhibitor domain-containing protein n=1 Tax=Brachypodium distachyon TaxID=15368 RepID=I1IHI4_BRADI|nr:hypothetical protein BRADI_4g04680v3 [Brachypodium distachyon]
MRPRDLAAFLLLLAAAALAPPPSAAVCVPRGKPVALPSPATKPKPKPAAPGGAVGGDIVKSLCAKADDPAQCVSSVSKQPAPAAGKKLDGPAVLRMAMGAVRAKAAEAKARALALAADPKTPKLAVGVLRDCAESYDDVPYSLDNADKAMASGDKDTTGTMLDTVRTDVDTCDQGFEDREELPKLMAKQDAELAKLASNCLAIVEAAGLR